jgi:hypothetical protein
MSTKLCAFEVSRSVVGLYPARCVVDSGINAIAAFNGIRSQSAALAAETCGPRLPRHDL